MLRAQAFRVHKVLEVVVVCEHKNFILAAFKVVLPCFKCFNNGQQLTVVGLVPSFSRNHLFREKGYWMPSAQII